MLQQLGMICDFIDEQNAKVYIPRGLFITDPIERGLRVVGLLALFVTNLANFLYYWCIEWLTTKLQNHATFSYIVISLIKTVSPLTYGIQILKIQSDNSRINK